MADQIKAFTDAKQKLDDMLSGPTAVNLNDPKAAAILTHGLVSAVSELFGAALKDMQDDG